MQQQAPTYFMPYGPYTTVASNSLSTSPTYSHLAAGLPAPWTTLTNSHNGTATNSNSSHATAGNPFLTAQYSQPQSQTNLAFQPVRPQSNPAAGSTWFEMGPVSNPTQTQSKSPASARPQAQISSPVIQSKTKELLRRCKNCGGYYLDDNDACSFHPGHFRSIFPTDKVEKLFFLPMPVFSFTITIFLFSTLAFWRNFQYLFIFSVRKREKSIHAHHGAADTDFWGVQEYQSMRYGSGGIVWSCCKSSRRDSPGCKQGKHVEDLDASRKLNEYGRLVESLAPVGKQERPLQRVPVPLQALQQQQQQEQRRSSSNSPAAKPASPKSPAIGQASPQTDLLIDLVDDLSIYPKPVEFMSHQAAQAPQQNEDDEDDDFNPRAHEVKPKQTNPTTGPAAGLRVSENQLKGAAPGCVKHFVKSTDTIVGLCMQYGINKQQLIEANRGLSNDNLYAFFELQIPQPASVKLIVTEDKNEVDSEAEKQKKLQQTFVRFKRSERVTDEEAKYYLTLTDWDYDRAVEERRLDVQFEQGSRSDPSKVKFSQKYEPRKRGGSGFSSPSSKPSSWF